MKRLIKFGRSSPQLGLVAVVALLMAGAAVMSSHDAEAAVLGFTVDTNVVLSGGTVQATAVFEDDTTTVLPDNSPQIWAPEGNVSPTGQVNGGALPAGITHESCDIDDATPADNCVTNPGDPDNAGPVGCDFPPQPGTACVQYGDANADTDTDSGEMTVVVNIVITCEENTAVPITASQPTDEGASQEVVWVYCLVDPNFTLEKVFEGEPADAEFEFTYNGPGCLLSIDGVPDPPAPIADGESFFLSNGETAEFFCGPGTHTVSEVNAIIETLTCDGTGAVTFDADAEAGTIEVTFPEDDAGGVLPCIMTNTGIETSNVTVEKICVDAEELEGTFSVALDDGEPVAIECDGDPVVFEDVEAGTHTLTETIEGDDADDFETVIICGDGVQQVGTTATLEVVAGEDQLCLVINGADITDLICDECPCGCNQLEIDIGNTNTNVIGIDNDNTNNNANDNDNDNKNENTNENENNNENTNTQNQDNHQDQDNSNTQTNNITSSPKVNIDFD